MFRRRLAIALVTATALPACLASAAEAKVVVRWEKLTVPMTEPAPQTREHILLARQVGVAPDATAAKGSSAVVSLGKLGRVE